MVAAAVGVIDECMMAGAGYVVVGFGCPMMWESLSLHGSQDFHLIGISLRRLEGPEDILLLQAV